MQVVTFLSVRLTESLSWRMQSFERRGIAIARPIATIRDVDGRLIYSSTLYNA